MEALLTVGMLGVLFILCGIVEIRWPDHPEVEDNEPEGERLTLAEELERLEWEIWSLTNRKNVLVQVLSGYVPPKPPTKDVQVPCPGCGNHNPEHATGESSCKHPQGCGYFADLPF